MSVAASLRASASVLPSLQTRQVALGEAKITSQICTSQKWNLRLGVVPSYSCVRLEILMLLIFLPNMYCHLYEIIIPKRLTVQERDNPVGKESYMLFMQGQKQLVHLKVKRGYSVTPFPVYSYHNGTLRQEMPFISRDCHYEGYIEGVPGSFVSVNTCSGLRGVLIKEETSYGIEPMLSSERFEHVLYTMAHQGRVSCSVTSKHSQGDTSQRPRSRRPQHVKETSFLWSHTKYVEMFVVVNNQRFQMWGSNISETVRAVVDIIALANSFTRAINTEVVLVGMEIWTEGDLVEVPMDLRVTLRNFNRWRQEKLLHRVRHDVAHMIVGHHPGENTGQAFLNGACSSEFAAAVESFHHEDVLLFAALMVHELGHNLGIPHDHAACACEERRFCLMRENITKHSGFSNCSSDFYYRFLREHRGACLFNRPWRQSRQLRDARCGNGVLEPPEQCDCGSDCDDHPCCERTCKLKASARCSDGLCCHRCDFKRKGALCRPVRDECDLPEYCNGSSQECPADSYKQDGTLCDRIYYCSGGQCKNPDKQCSSIYGLPARSAPEECYISINSKGTRFGNCGRGTGNKSEYVGCADDNVFCGKLICTGVVYLPSVKPQHTLIQVRYEDDWCWSMDAYSTVDIPDSGDVQNGTYCAPNKVCMGNACTDYRMAQYDCQPRGTCHGKGVCNNLQHCHCDDGFAPPDCDKPGNGGSVDSGPVGKPVYGNFIINPTHPVPKAEINMNIIIFVVPTCIVILLCSLLLIAYLWSEVEAVVATPSDSEDSSEIPSEVSESEEPPPEKALPPEAAPPPPEAAPPPPEAAPPPAESTPPPPEAAPPPPEAAPPPPEAAPPPPEAAPPPPEAAPPPPKAAPPPPEAAPPPPKAAPPPPKAAPPPPKAAPPPPKAAPPPPKAAPPPPEAAPPPPKAAPPPPEAAPPPPEAAPPPPEAAPPPPKAAPPPPEAAPPTS